MNLRETIQARRIMLMRARACAAWDRAHRVAPPFPTDALAQVLARLGIPLDEEDPILPTGVRGH